MKVFLTAVCVLFVGLAAESARAQSPCPGGTCPLSAPVLVVPHATHRDAAPAPAADPGPIAAPAVVREMHQIGPLRKAIERRHERREYRRAQRTACCGR
jgi:hypothetical protein